MPGRIIHPCIYAEKVQNDWPYICKIKKCNCKSQFFCQVEKYWRPTYEIKCPDFIDKEKEEKKEETLDNKK